MSTLSVQFFLINLNDFLHRLRTRSADGHTFLHACLHGDRNVSGAAIHQRIQKLTNLGILLGSQFLIDPEKIGYETCAYIGLYLKNPEDFDRVVEALKKIPEVVECHITTGDYDLFIKIFARNNHHMMDIIHDKLQPLGLSRSKSLISFKTVIDRPLPIEENPNAPQEEDKE